MNAFIHNPDCSVSGPLTIADGEELLKCKRNDLIASHVEESFGVDTHKLFKVVTKDSEGHFPVEEGWNLVKLYEHDQDFLDKFLDNSEKVQDFNDRNLAFIEGRKNVFHNLIVQQ